MHIGPMGMWGMVSAALAVVGLTVLGEVGLFLVGWFRGGRFRPLNDVRCPAWRLRWAVRRLKPDSYERRVAIVSNPACPPELLQKVVDSAPSDATTLWTLAGNPSCPPDILQELAGHLDDHVAHAAIANPNCPDHIKAIAILGRSGPLKEGPPIRLRVKRRFA